MAGARIGQILESKYRLDEELGRGGMGVVYRAFHLRVHKEFAVKVLSSEVAGKKSIAARLVLEAQAAGRIGHPGILDVYDVGEDRDGRPFLVMELLRGETLSAVIARGALTPKTACWVATQVLEILDAAHRAGVIHRDVKPQNVFLVAPTEQAEEGPRVVKLLDFGIAKFKLEDGTAITGSGEVMGSPLYMAPEQARGEDDVDPRVDVWSVGAMLYEMLAGKPAHSASTAIAVLSKILTETVPPVSSGRGGIPREIDAVVQGALVIERDDRFASAKVMLDALETARSSLGWTTAAPAFPAAPLRPSRSQRPEAALADADAEAEKITAKDAPSSKRDRSSREPVMESAVTAGTITTTRGRTVGIAIAVVVLAGGAALPFVLPGFGTKTPAASTSAGPEPSVSAMTSPSTSTSARSGTGTGTGTGTGESVVAKNAEPDAAAVADAGSVGQLSAEAGAAKVSPSIPVRRVDSKPVCEAGEVLSLGHCCPGGHVWQSGRCERPLATSF